MNAEEASRAIGCSSKTVLRYIAKGTITATHKHAQELSIANDQVEKLRQILVAGTKSGQSTDMSQQIENLTARVAELEEKVRTLESGLVPLQVRATVQATSPPVPTLPYVETPVREKPQKATTTRKGSVLPEGCILTIDFARNHDVKRETFRDHIKIGLGKGFIHGPDVPEDGSVQVKDYVKAESRPKPGREHETEYYLTQEQQCAALEFWRRHDVKFEECDRAECSCHTFEGKDI